MRQLAKTESVTHAPLEETFQAFNRVSEELINSYQELELRVVKLNQALASENLEKKRHLSDKEKLNDQLECLLEFLPCAVIVLNSREEITRANAYARSWLVVDLIGQYWNDLKTECLSPSSRLASEYVLDTGKVVALSKKRLADKEGFVVLLSDVTEQRELYQELEHKKKLASLGQFSASLAHQIRTPLSAALLYASQLKSGVSEPVKASLFSQKIIDNLKALNLQVSDMLNYAHFGEFNRVDVPMLSLVENLKSVYEGGPEKPLFKTVNIGSDMKIHTSQEALIGAICNLINNAEDAQGTLSGVLCQFKACVDNVLEVTVSDKGPGLEVTKLLTIFEPFYSDKTKGTGLGLAVVNEVVKAHGGDVRCHSELGYGAKFLMRLPIIVATDEEFKVVKESSK